MDQKTCFEDEVIERIKTRRGRGWVEFGPSVEAEVTLIEEEVDA